MSRYSSMTQAAVTSAMEQNADQDFVILLEIIVSDAASTLRFTNQAVARMTDGSNDLLDSYGRPIYGVVHGGYNYYYLPFDISLPSAEQGKQQQTQISIDNLTRELMPWLRELAARPSVVIKVVHTSSLNTVQTRFDGLFIASVSYDEDTIDCALDSDLLTNDVYPFLAYTPNWNPAMFGGGASL